MFGFSYEKKPPVISETKLNIKKKNIDYKE